jgi:hypothetical protein
MFQINHLIGFGAFADAAAAGTTSLAFHDDAYSITNTIDVPAGLEAGDLIVLSDVVSDNSAAPAASAPSGFTIWIDLIDVSGTGRTVVSYKIATGSETTLTGMSADDFMDKILAVFRPDVPITSITASTPTTEATGGNPSAQNIVATGGTLPLIAFGIYSALGSAVSPRTMTPAATGELNSTTRHYVKYQLQNASLADVSVDMDDEGKSNSLAVGYLWAA